MKPSVRLGKIAGIPVGANWTVAVILLLVADILGTGVLPATIRHQPPVIYWLIAMATALLFMASLLAHELAHALVAKHNGMAVKSITLWMLGGMTELDGDPPNAGADLRIALAGPATSLAAAALFAGTAGAIGQAGGSGLVVAAMAWLALMNGVLAVFNLLPGAPLDGGRVLRAVLWWIHKDRRRAATAAARSGWYLGLAISAAGAAELLVWRDLGGLWPIMIGWFLMIAARSEGAAVALTAAMTGMRVADVMTPHPDAAAAWSTVEQFIDEVVVRSRQNVFPVLGFDGELAGIVSRGMLARVGLAGRQTLRLDKVAMAVPGDYLAAPGDPAESVLGRPALAGDLIAVVVEYGRVIGIVTVTDISNVALRARLRSAPRMRLEPQPDAIAGMRE